MELGHGTQVNPNVRLIRELGRGAMGTVWIADHLTLGTEVAVKFIAQDVAAENPEIVTRFEREASVAAQIKSPHVVQTFDRGVMDDGTPYIVMELLDGKSLWRRIDEDGPLSLAETAQVVVQVARALRRAHDLGIIHRDIKPDNVFVTTPDDAIFCKVLDFGIAKQSKLPALEGLTSPGMLVGTPEYMSPEQFLTTDDIDFKADLWALAVTAYQCLTNALPFPAKTLGALCAQLMKGTFSPPTEFRDDLPPEVDAWFLRALAKDPNERFPSAREMAHAFALLLPPQDRGFEDTIAHSGRGASSTPLRTPRAEQATRVSMPNPASSDGVRLGTGEVPLQRGNGRVLALALGAVLLVGGGFAASRRSAEVVEPASRQGAATSSARADAPLPRPTAAADDVVLAAASASPSASAQLSDDPARSESTAASSASTRPLPVQSPASAAKPSSTPAATGTAKATPGNYGF